MSPLEPLVRFIGVDKSFDGATRVVADLDLDIAPGEFLTLLGPSGSGKTTTLMMLAGFEDPSAGEILFEGRRLNNVPPHRRGIGVVFQNYALFPHMNVAQNLAFPLEMQGLTKPEIGPRIARALDMVRLAGMDDRRPSQLSGGQQQRVALARALIFEPKLILMDEPLGALDKQLREQMQLEIKHIHERLGVTLVYVTHDQSEALTMSDRIAVFNDGRIQQLGTPEAIYDSPANAFVASFIGQNNRLDGTVLARDGGRVRVALADGTAIVARAVADLAPGARTVLSIRPERVALGAQTDGLDNRFPATLLESIYLGDHRRLRLALGGSEAFFVAVERAADGATPARGEDITVGWTADACVALSAEDDKP